MVAINPNFARWDVNSMLVDSAKFMSHIDVADPIQTNAPLN